MTNFEKEFQGNLTPEQDIVDENFQVKTTTFEVSSENFLENLEKDRIISIDLELTEKEKETLKRLEINKNSDNFHYWGNTDSVELYASLNLFLKDIGENSENTIEEISKLIIRIGQGLSKVFNTESVWYEMRSITPNNFFTTPRWHTDAKFFNPLNAHKLVFALKGAQTRFGITTDKDRFVQLSIDENKEKHGSEEDIRIRKELDLIVDEIYPTSGDQNATVYLVTGDDAIIHSEPQINESRLFMSIIPGTEDEISEWKHRMEEKRLRKKSQI